MPINFHDEKTNQHMPLAMQHKIGLKPEAIWEHGAYLSK